MLEYRSLDRLGESVVDRNELAGLDYIGRLPSTALEMSIPT